MAYLFQLLSQVKEWLEKSMDFADSGFVDQWAEKLKQFLEKYCPTCWDKIVEATKITLEIALGILNSSKDNILKVCRENEAVLKSMVLKLGTKSFTKLVAQETAQVMAKEGVRYGVRTVARTGVRGGARLVARTTTRVIARSVGKVALKAVSNPLGSVADIAQAGLELTGNKKAGKTVGLAGNAGGGALAGLALGGPVGAAAGAVVGTSIWLVGELVGGLFG